MLLKFPLVVFQAVTRRASAAWAAVPPAVRNAPVATAWKEPNASVTSCRSSHRPNEGGVHDSCPWNLDFSCCLSDVDECKEREIACPGLNEACINEEGSFHCDCADGFIRRDSICVENKPPGKQSQQQQPLLFSDRSDSFRTKILSRHTLKKPTYFIISFISVPKT